MTRLERLWIASALLLGSACAGAPKPVDQLVDTQAAVRAAQEVGAEHEPKAELHLKLAQEQLQHAQQLTHDGDNKEAARVLSRAKADADLALALARGAKVDGKLRQARASAQEPALSSR